MSAEKKVFSRLFKQEKTELATQKIELGVSDIGDIRKGARKTHDSLMVESNQDLSKAIKVIANILKNLSSGKKKLDAFESDLDSKIKRNEKLAKEIGIDIANTSVGKEMTKAMGEIDDLKKSLDRKLKNVANIKIK